jgi:hypothetical protein
VTQPDSPSSSKSQQFEQLRKVVAALLSGDTHSEDYLNEQIRKFQPLVAADLDDTDLDRLARVMTAQLTIEVNRGTSVTAKDFKPWLEERKRDISWDRWIAYKQWLFNNGRAPRVVDRMDELTDAILDFVGDPAIDSSDWQRRGLVIGDVQSGKTASYLGLFNKAIDAGYRLIIVLAGHTESLRQQTQARIDEGVIGRDSSRRPRSKATERPPRYIGVGSLRKDLANAIGMTTVTTDFRTGSLEATSHEVGSHPSTPYIFVVKKNKGILAGVHEWLRDQRINENPLDLPLLLLDDESDYASINTREEVDPTAINNAIRDILGLFAHASYLGFTATPFANIFIDHTNNDDLFPRDYIYSLESPSNYVGAAKVFGEDAGENGMLQELPDAVAVWPLKHKSNLVVTELPESLKDAIRTFLLSNAIRDLRNQLTEPRSMLINVSRFTRVQDQVHTLVQDELAALRNAVQLHAVSFAEGVPNAEMELIRESFDKHYAASQQFDGPFGWAKVLEALPGAVADIRTRLVNSKVDRKLAEENLRSVGPPRQIAVGGDVLSRGLTLDGLTVSYFFRHTQASDTLMQMARWFGYRDGYADLCKLWIESDVAASFAFVADSVADLRRELQYMHDQELTPRDFGLAVRKHPGSLLVTARNKMKAAETRTARISLRSRGIETPKLPADTTALAQNLNAVIELARAVESEDSLTIEALGRNRGWRGVPKQRIADLLIHFRAHKSNALFSLGLAHFVRDTKSGDLQTWDVVVISGQGDEVPLGQHTFNAPKRRASLGSDQSLLVSGSSLRVAGREDIAEVLTAEQKNKAVTDYRRATNDLKANTPEGEFLRFLTRPLLLIYPIQLDFKKADNGNERSKEFEATTAIALKLAFPTGPPRTNDDADDDVEYVINTVAQESWFIEFSAGSEPDDDVDA